VALKLNLGAGDKRPEGFVNVDMFGEPDVHHDLESFPWPWEESTVDEILMIHVLEHLGQQPSVFIGIMKELYRICEPDAVIRIAVPHHRHDNFFADPTHVRPVTSFGLSLFSQKANLEWQAAGAANSPLGLYHDVDFEIVKTTVTPSQIWRNRYPQQVDNVQLLARESNIYNNLIEQVDIELKVIKPGRASAKA
jgi:hypothetical protein